MNKTKSMDSVFDQNTESQLDFDIIFDEDDSLIDIVKEAGTHDDDVDFDDLHQTQDDTLPKDFKDEKPKDDFFGAKDPEGSDKDDYDDMSIGNLNQQSYADKYYGDDPLERNISSGKVQEGYSFSCTDIDSVLDPFGESSDDVSDDDVDSSDIGTDDNDDESTNEECNASGGLPYDIDELLDPKNGDTPEGCCPIGSKKNNYQSFYGDDPLERKISAGKLQEGYMDIDSIFESFDDDEGKEQEQLDKDIADGKVQESVDDNDMLDEASGIVNKKEVEDDDDEALIDNVSKSKNKKHKELNLGYDYDDDELIDMAMNEK